MIDTSKEASLARLDELLRKHPPKEQIPNPESAVAVEREACAKLVELLSDFYTCQEMADAIRARSVL